MSIFSKKEKEYSLFETEMIDLIARVNKEEVEESIENFRMGIESEEIPAGVRPMNSNWNEKLQRWESTV